MQPFHFSRRHLLRAAIAAPQVISRHPTHYHAWPTVCRRRSGELVATYSGAREGHVCPFGRVEFIRSRDEGQTWSWPQVLMDTAIDDRDSGILETPKGTLLVTTFTSLAYERVLAEAKGWEQDRLERWNAVQRGTTPAERQSLLGYWMLRSTDNGITWSPPYRVPVTAPHGPIALSNGRLLFAGNQGGRPRSLAVYESADDGFTWIRLSGLTARPGDDPELYYEPHAVETADGRILVHLRNHNKVNERETLQTESSDGGRTWSTPRSIGVWGLPSHLLRLSDGRLVMSYGYRRAPRGVHTRVSADHGRSWSEPIVLYDSGTGDIGYPSTVELAPGRMLTLWYESKRSGATPVKLPEPPFSELRLARWTPPPAR